MAVKIKPSNRNTNRHTESGMELLSKSVSKVGAIDEQKNRDEMIMQLKEIIHETKQGAIH